MAFLLAAVAAPQIGRAEPVPLVFSTFVPGTNVSNLRDLGPGYTGGLTMSFINVATREGTTIDARVTAVVQPNTRFATGASSRMGRGFVPNYKATISGEPKGDLGFLYDGVDKNAPGVTLTLSFFNGTGDLRGKFSEPYVVPDLQLLVYDVDGEPTQTEWFDAFYADGLHSYATGTAAASVTAMPTPAGAGVHFLGCGKDFPETDTSGAVLLRYLDTSRVTLAFGAEQYSEGRNPVFSAIDGSMSLPMTGGFKAPTVIPAPQPPQNKSGLWSASLSYPTGDVLRLDRIMPAEVPVNVPFDYTLKVTNLTESPLHDVVVTECLPANFALQSSDPESEREDANLRWRVGSLDPKASREIKISGVATTVENLKPCATVTFIASAGVCADVAVVEPKLTLTETAPLEVLLCDPIPTQIVVANAGTGAIEGVKIVNTLPDGMTTLDGRSELILEAGTLAPGQSKHFTGKFKASRTGEFVNTAVAVANGDLRAEATATTLVRQPVLEITKTGPARQYIGRQTTYEITVTNKGDASAADTLVEDTIPQGAKGVQASPAGVVSGSKVVWQLGTLAVNASKTVRITYIPMGAGPLAQTATASAICAEPVTATAETAIYGIAAVLLEVVDTDDPVQIGGQTTYLITATNQGSSPTSNVQITAIVEDTQEIVAANGPTPVIVEGNVARSSPLPTLAPQAKATWQITVRALRPGDVRFRASMTTADLERNVEETEATQQYE
jgi:uncharacterized repeat protein (TIGR01451 family)